MKRCVKCETLLEDESRYCPKCGSEQPSASDFTPGGRNDEAIDAEVVNENKKETADDRYYWGSDSQNNNDYESLPMWRDNPGFAFWIVSLVTLGVVGLVFGILGLRKSRNAKNKYMAKIGIIISIVYLVLVVTLYIILFALAMAGIIKVSNQMG